MHRTGTKHIVRHMQKSVVQWSVISRFTCNYINNNNDKNNNDNNNDNNNNNNDVDDNYSNNDILYLNISIGGHFICDLSVF